MVGTKSRPGAGKRGADSKRSNELDISRMTDKGQITLTADVRRAIGLQPGDRVLMTLRPDKSIVLRRLLTPDEFMATLPVATVPPIDWKALREEHADELAEKTLRVLREASERRATPEKT